MTQNGKHTPGPWNAVNGTLVQSSNQLAIADCWRIRSGVSPFDERQAAANTSLIAAAPELLEALEALYSHPQKHILPSSFQADMAKARVAIAKARGEAA